MSRMVTLPADETEDDSEAGFQERDPRGKDEKEDNAAEITNRY